MKYIEYLKAEEIAYVSLNSISSQNEVASRRENPMAKLPSKTYLL